MTAFRKQDTRADHFKHRFQVGIQAEFMIEVTPMGKNKWIEIKTELPGPKARAVLEQDRRFVSPSYSRPYPLVAKEAQGMVVTDMD